MSKNIKVSEDLIFAIGQAYYADSQRSNKLKDVKQNRQCVKVNSLDSDFFGLKDDFSNKLIGKHQALVSDVIKLSEATHCSINVKNYKNRTENEQSSQSTNKTRVDMEINGKKESKRMNEAYKGL